MSRRYLLDLLLLMMLLEDPTKVTADGLHPNSLGYDLMYGAIMD